MSSNWRQNVVVKSNISQKDIIFATFAQQRQVWYLLELSKHLLSYSTFIEYILCIYTARIGFMIAKISQLVRKTSVI